MAMKDMQAARAALQYWNMPMSDFDPEADSNLGGLSMMNTTRNKNICAQPRNHQAKQLHGKAGVQLYVVRIDRDVYVLVYDTYGYTNGDVSDDTADRSNDIIEAIIDDIKCQPRGPVLILGDLDASIHRPDCLNQGIKDKRLTDVAAQADKWGNAQFDYTCNAHSANNNRRVDYIFVRNTGWP